MSEHHRFIDQDLISRIEDFISRGGLSPTSFGVRCVNDPRLLADLKEGRELRRKTREKIEAFIRGDA